MASEKKVLLSKTTIIIAAEIIVLAALIFGVKYIGDTYYDPLYVAECYFETLMEGNLDAAYDYLDIQESEFLSKEMFEKTYEVEDRGRLGSFTTKEKKSKENAVLVEITYRLKNEAGDKTKQIIMEKQGKKCLFFNDWKVNIGKEIKRGIDITAPSGSKVLLDDVELGGKYKKTSEYGMDGYSIDALFCGNHIIKASREDAQDIVQTEYINPSDDSEVLIGVKKLKLKKEKLEQLKETTQEVFKKIMDAKSKGEDSGFVNDLIKHEKGAEITRKNYDDFLKMNATSFYVDRITVVAMNEDSEDVVNETEITDEIVAETYVTGMCHFNGAIFGKLAYNVGTVMYYGYIDGKLSLIGADMKSEFAGVE